MPMESIGFVRGGRVEATKDGWGSNLGADEPTEYGARRPRGRADWPTVGIFAQHGRMRPNRIGVSVCDVSTGIYAALLVLAALRERDLYGRGRRLDVAMLDVASEFAAPMLLTSSS